MDFDRLARIFHDISDENIDPLNRALAADLATMLLENNGYDWTDVIKALQEYAGRGRSDWHRRMNAVEDCLQCPELNDWQRNFLKDISTFQSISNLQAAHFKAICVKCGVRWQ